jgi:hypothetical protein
MLHCNVCVPDAKPYAYCSCPHVNDHAACILVVDPCCYPLLVHGRVGPAEKVGAVGDGA